MKYLFVLSFVVFSHQCAQLNPAFGVLLADPTFLMRDTANNVSIAFVEIGWNNWMPYKNNTPNANYKNQILSKVQQYKNAGFRVGVTSGLQYPPTWITNTSGGVIVDQNNNHGKVNIFFSPTVRTAATLFMQDLTKTVGSLVDWMRVGTSEAGECYLSNAVGKNDSWWAFDQFAQSTTNYIASVGPNPMPGWIPGSPTYNSKNVNATMAQTWWNWYQNSVIDALKWQISTLRGEGFTGQIMLPMPGIGLGPNVHDNRIKTILAPWSLDGPHAMSIAAAWYIIIPSLAAYDSNLIIDSSSVGDSSGTVPCNSTDATFTQAQADPWYSKWSGTRWVSYLARKQGIPMMGENPGSNSAAQVPGIVSLARSCSLEAILWAFDYQLYDGTHANASVVSSALKVNTKCSTTSASYGVTTSEATTVTMATGNASGTSSSFTDSSTSTVTTGEIVDGNYTSTTIDAELSAGPRVICEALLVVIFVLMLL